MSIQLLNFPYLIQRNILKQMDYGDLFFFSLISRKSIKLIQNVNWREVKRIQFNTSSDMIGLLIDDGQHGWTGFLEIFPTERLRGKESMGQLYNINISGVDLTYRMPTESLPHVFYFNKGDDYEAISEIVYNQLNIIFGSHVKFVLGETNLGDKFFLPKFIPFKQTYLCHYQKLHSNVLEKYFKSVPEQEHVDLTVTNLKGNFKRTSKVYNAQELHLRFSARGAPLVLAHFRGRTACLECAFCREKDIVKFLKRWKSREAFHNLESFEIQMVVNFNFERVAAEVEIKQLPDSIGPQTVKLSEKEPSMFITDDITEIITSSYIVRNDGIVGIIAVSPRHFVFKVKKITEEEMLQRQFLPV